MSSKPKPSRNKYAASQLANGSSLFLDGERIDGRSVTARRFREHVFELSEQVAPGRSTTHGEDVLIRRAAMLAVLSEMDETKLIAGDPIDGRAYAYRSNALMGILARLGAVKSAGGSKAKTIDHDPHTRALVRR